MCRSITEFFNTKTSGVIIMVFILFFSHHVNKVDGKSGVESESPPLQSSLFKIKGVNFPVYSPEMVTIPVIRENLREMKRIGVNSISLEILWQQDFINSSQVKKNYESVSDEWLEGFVREAKVWDFSLLIKPIIEVSNNVSLFIKPSNVSEWFNSYSQLLLPLASLCEKVGVDSLSIALEVPFISTPLANLPLWTDLIKRVRQVYQYGQITYAALYYHEYEKVPFWNLLDIIGIEAYYPMAVASNPNPSLSEMKQIFFGNMEYLRKWKIHYLNKPIVFTEIGYPSTQICAIQPTLFPTRSVGCTGELFSPNTTCQSAAYSTMFSVLPSFTDILDGLYIFSWDNPSTPDYHDGGKLFPCFFTPRNKPAFNVLSNGYIH